jgi:hypothetical protein
MFWDCGCSLVTILTRAKNTTVYRATKGGDPNLRGHLLLYAVLYIYNVELKTVPEP